MVLKQQVHTHALKLGLNVSGMDSTACHLHSCVLWLRALQNQMLQHPLALANFVPFDHTV